MKQALQTAFATEDLALRLRRHVVRMCASGGGAHVGSNLSMADIIAVLYGEVLRVDPAEPGWPERDRFILSKGHACACGYAVLAERGFLPLEVLQQHYRNGSRLSGHISHKGVPGVEFSTGSLGHGLGVGAGMAMQLRRTGGSQRVYVVLSDGECDEGSTWEAMMMAANLKLDNLVAFMDFNDFGGLERMSDGHQAFYPLVPKAESFGWEAVEVDGHDEAAMQEAVMSRRGGRPFLLVCRTVKGKGISFMENVPIWHYRSPNKDEYLQSLKELADAPL